MNPIKVKICGITRKNDLTVAAEAGADAVGFVVGAANSPRNLTFKKASTLFKLVPPFVKSVLVTVPSSIDTLVRNYRRLNPNVVQIHGDKMQDEALIRKKIPNVPLIRSVNANSSTLLQTALAKARIFDGLHLDSLTINNYGGTGLTHDWNLSRRIKKSIEPVPLILAGGLNPENVVAAINIVQPYAVDVSSGVESKPGIKDAKKIFTFIKNAKEVKT